MPPSCNAILLVWCGLMKAVAAVGHYCEFFLIPDHLFNISLPLFSRVLPHIIRPSHLQVFKQQIFQLKTFKNVFQINYSLKYEDYQSNTKFVTPSLKDVGFWCISHTFDLL